MNGETILGGIVTGLIGLAGAILVLLYALFYAALAVAVFGAAYWVLKYFGVLMVAPILI